MGCFWMAWLRSWVNKLRPSERLSLCIRLYKVWSCCVFALFRRPFSIFSTPGLSLFPSSVGSAFTFDRWGICINGRDFQYSEQMRFLSKAWIACGQNGRIRAYMQLFRRYLYNKTDWGSVWFKFFNQNDNENRWIVILNENCDYIASVLL